MAYITEERVPEKADGQVVGWRTVHRLYWLDATKGAGQAGRRVVTCESDKGDHADAMDAAELPGDERAALASGAKSRALRKSLLRCYEALERKRAREAARLGGRQARRETLLADLVDAYREVLAYKVALKRGERGPRPDRATWWRPAFVERPMSAATLTDQRTTLTRFRDAVGRRTTGDLSPDVLADFLGSVLDRGASARTHNKTRTYLRTLFASLTRDAAASLFRSDPRDLFRDDVEALPATKPEIIVHSSADLARFLEAAEAAADPGRVVEVHRTRRGKVEAFSQPATVRPAPVLEAALLLLCTGMRRGEALALRWADVDLERGILTVRATKTSTVRYVPLLGDPAGDVAPRFLELLRAWREADPARATVHPENGEGGPAFTRAWARVMKAADVEVGPQGCRRTFESALACIGVPSTLSAFWLGHSPQVAARHYLAYAPGRLPGRTVEEVLGLVPFIERATERARAGRAFRKVDAASSGR